MKPAHIYRQASQDEVAPFVAQRLIAQLEQGKKVLWLLSGGSGGAVCIGVSKLLAGHDLSNLCVTMSDERYGEPGHPDENVTQLLDDGLTLPGATFYRPLTGASLEATTAAFAAWLSETTQTADYSIAVLGIGEDAHTAGIKPHSVAITSTEPAASFTGDDFERITITSRFLKQLDEAVVQAYGATKHAVVQQLIEAQGSEADAPMLAIRSIARTTIFSDYKEELA